jgi:hypothetical protein
LGKIDKNEKLFTFNEIKKLEAKERETGLQKRR